MIWKTTTCASVQLKIVRDFEIQSNNWKDDSIEWFGEALSKIGCHAGYKNYCARLKVKCHKVLIPCYFTEIHLVEYLNRPLKSNQGQRKANFQIYGYGKSQTNTVFSYVDINTGVTIERSYNNCNNFIEDAYFDVLQADYITTSFEEGWITLYGIGYNVDEDGYPLIPDSPYVREALAFYSLMKWLGRGNKHMVFTYETAEQRWKDYRFKAQNECIFPSIQQMDAFNNMWVRLVPDRSMPESFFTSGQNQQQIPNV